MGDIHELFVLALSLVWFAGATSDRCFYRKPPPLKPSWIHLTSTVSKNDASLSEELWNPQHESTLEDFSASPRGDGDSARGQRYDVCSVQGLERHHTLPSRKCAITPSCLRSPVRLKVIADPKMCSRNYRLKIRWFDCGIGPVWN